MPSSEKKPHPRVKPKSGQPFPNPACHWVGDRGLRVLTGDATTAYYALLVSRNLTEVEDIIPADGSLLLVLRRGAADKVIGEVGGAQKLSSLRKVIDVHRRHWDFLAV